MLVLFNPPLAGNALAFFLQKLSGEPLQEVIHRIAKIRIEKL
jgi:hypothetical protein